METLLPLKVLPIPKMPNIKRKCIYSDKLILQHLKIKH